MSVNSCQGSMGFIQPEFFWRDSETGEVKLVNWINPETGEVKPVTPRTHKRIEQILKEQFSTLDWQKGKNEIYTCSIYSKFQEKLKNPSPLPLRKASKEEEDVEPPLSSPVG